MSTRPPVASDVLAEHSSVHDWLTLPTWRAFAVDEAGRVLAGSDATGTVQLVELEAGSGAAVPLTALAGAVTGRYLPGRRSVVVQHDDGGDENAQLSLIRLDGAARLPARLDALQPLARAPGVVHRLLDVRPDRVYYATNARNGVDFDVVVLDVGPGGSGSAGSAARGRVLYSGGGHVEDVAVAPDGERLVVTLSSPVAMSSHLLLVDGDGTTSLLTQPDEVGRLHRVAWAADGGSIVVTTDAETDTTLVSRFDLQRRRWSPLVAHDDWDVSGWPSPDGRLLLVETLVDGESRLAVHDALSGSLVHTVHLPGAGTPGAGVVSFPMPDPVWSPDSSRVALSFSSPSVPGDVLLLDAGTGEIRPATTGDLPDGREAVLPTSHRVPTPDGERVPCFLYPGCGAGEGGGEGSSVLLLHGGPEGQSVRCFNPLVQALTGAGHTVVVPNVRGSTGYGRRWYSMDDGPRRLDAVADLAALHAWLPSKGLDPGRSALWGASYGGYLVLAGLAFQPGLWAAGVDIVGISSLVTFLERTSGYRRAVREREYGRLATDRADLEAASPLGRIDEVVAPLFVIHGANDPRVPLSEAEQLVAALDARSVACELRVYADEGHGLAKRANRLDAYPAAIDFLGRHLGVA